MFLISYLLYDLWKNLIFRVLLSVQFVMVFTSVLLVKTNNTGELEIRYFPNEYTSIILEGIFPSFIPIIFIVFIFLSIDFVKKLYTSTFLHSILSNGFSRRVLLNYSYLLIFLVSLVTAFSCNFFYELDFAKFLGLFLSLCIIYMQITFLFSVGIAGNATLLIYLIFFLFIPFAIKDFVLISLVQNVHELIYQSVNYLFEFMSVAWDIFGVNPSKQINMPTLVASILLMYLVSIISFSKKEFY